MPDKPRPAKKSAKPTSKANGKVAAEPAAKATNKPAAKRAVKATAPPTSAAATKPRARKPVVFVQAPQLSPVITTDKPRDAANRQEFATFADAKEAGIDALVLAIEALEDQLHQLKRAADLEDFAQVRKH